MSVSPRMMPRPPTKPDAVPESLQFRSKSQDSERPLRACSGAERFVAMIPAAVHPFPSCSCNRE